MHDEGRALPPPLLPHLGEALEMVLAVTPMQRDRYVRALLEKVRREGGREGGREGRLPLLL